jgi:hypothetical protein
VKTGTDAAPAHLRVLTEHEFEAWAAAVRDGSGAPRYYHLVLVDTVAADRFDTSVDPTLRKGTQRTISFGNTTLDPRDWFISAEWDDGAGNTGTLDLAAFSAVRDVNPYPQRPQAVDVDLSGVPVPDGTNVKVTLRFRAWIALSGIQGNNGPVTVISVRGKELFHAGNNANVTAAVLNTMIHEPAHAMGLAATRLPDGTALATTVFNNGHHCRNIGNRCVMFDANSTNTDLCPFCSDALRGRKLVAIPLSGSAAYA